MSAAIPPRRPRPVRTMADTGMDMSHTLVRPPKSPLVQRDCQIGARYLACRTFAITHRECAVYQTALRNYYGLFPRMAGETGGSSRDDQLLLSPRDHPARVDPILLGQAWIPPSRLRAFVKP